jgi:hypothetical protein
MIAVRRRLGRLAGAWLVFQLCLVASVPTAACAGLPAAAHGAECTCSHDDGQTCPMHHRTAKSTAKTCSCRSATDPVVVTIAGLWGPSAVLPTAIHVATPFVHPGFVSSPTTFLAEALVLPDAPPPRA